LYRPLPQMDKSFIEYLLSVKYWDKPLCMFISPNLLVGWKRKLKLREVKVKWLGCSVSHMVIYNNICNANSSLWIVLYQGSPLTFCRLLEIRPFQLESSKTRGNSLKPMRKPVWGWGKILCLCLLSHRLSNSLKNVPALMGEINHHLGSMRGISFVCSTESGFWTGPLEGLRSVRKTIFSLKVYVSVLLDYLMFLMLPS
jgi:hypothetical protein